MSENLSEAEHAAIELLRSKGGCMLISEIDDKTSTDVFGMKVPGMAIFKKLIKRNMMWITDEDTIDIDGEPFMFTPMIYLGPEPRD